MSLINKMLRDLDRRNAVEGGIDAASPGSLAEHVRPVSGWGMASSYFWSTAAVLMLIALGWIAWVVWQSMHRQADADLLEPSREQTPGQRAETPLVAAAPVSAPAVSAAATPAAPAPAAAASPAVATPVEMARVEVPVSAPAAAAVGSPAVATPATAVIVETPVAAPAATAPAPERAPRRRPARAAPRKPLSVAQAKPVEPAPASEPADSGKIDRRMNTNPRDSAENEFRKAVGLVNRGRVAEGMDGFRSTLEIDPAHEAARQTLVALLLEAKRVDEAAVVLEKGLALNPENSTFAMLRARISVEHGDVPGALALLQKHAAAADRSPDYHAFEAALYQRLDQHKEAIEQYRKALSLAPSAAVWWVGLGISFQAAQQPKEALEAFTRAKAAGNLAPELSGFVEQRLKQIQ